MKCGGLAALLGIALAVSSEAGTLDDLAREFPRSNRSSPPLRSARSGFMPVSTSSKSPRSRW